MGASGEQQPGFPGIGAEYLLSKKTCALMAVVAFVGCGYAAYESLGDEGEVSGRDAQVEPHNPDSDLRVISWNMHGEASNRISEVERLIKEEHTNVVLMQEVTSEDHRIYQEYFEDKGWSLRHIPADKRQEMGSGGLGNMIMAHAESIDDIESKVFKGNSQDVWAMRTVTGLAQDVATRDFTLSASRKALYENRAAIAGTIELHGQKYRIITSHIARLNGEGDPDQLDQLMDFVEDNTRDDYLTIFCGDLNSPPEQVINVFAQKAGYVTARTGPTSVNGPQVLDYCFSHDPHNQTVGNITVNRNYQTDHYPVVANWILGNTEK